MANPIPEHKKAVSRRLKADFPLYARHCLRIRDKAGRTNVPLELNQPQLYLHERIEDQLRRTGRVRIIVLKGRQQGISTYTEARFYWKTSTRMGVNSLVIAHEQLASDNLFGMAKRYHEGVPDDLRPSVLYSNAKEFKFGRLDSGYKVLTAGTKAVGRGNSATLLHASEFAFWSNADEHMAGIAQAVPDEDGTEIIIESTAKGLGNEFHKKVQQARAGKGDYELVFIPWFWSSEYRRTPPDDWQRTEQEDELAELYGLDDEQLAWRRNKIESDFAGDEIKFLEEYPCTPDEAFQGEKRETFISIQDVVAARRYILAEPATGPLVVSCDPARFGDDRTAICWRRGREMVRIVAKQGLSTMQVAGQLVQIIKKDRPVKVFIDVIGIGAGIVDRLEELGYGHIVVAVNASASANDDTRWKNKRAECWGLMREWLQTRCVSIADADVLQQDLLQPGFKYDSSGRTQLESKDDIKKRGAPSPDLADALSLTFAEDVAVSAGQTEEPTGSIAADPVGGY